MNSEALSVPEKFANAKPKRSNTVVPVVVKPYVGNLAKSFRLRVCGATQHGCCWKPFSMLFLQSKFDSSHQQTTKLDELASNNFFKSNHRKSIPEFIRSNFHEQKLWPLYDAVSAASSLLRIFLRITNKMYQVISIRTKNT